MQQREGQARAQGATRFNPHPARRPDATSLRRRIAEIRNVSILIRPEGRMQHAVSYAVTNHTHKGFNPHPARRPDATPQVTAYCVKCKLFQSSSGQKAGCNTCGHELTIVLSKFQSSSGQKAGCNISSLTAP